ncbi:MAG: acyl-CoA thioesterase, partial [Burkholderiales bacterium]
LGSARYDDVLAVCCRVGRLGRSSMMFRFEIFRDDPGPASTPLVTAELVYVNADPSNMTPAPLPQELRERISGYERVAPQT